MTAEQAAATKRAGAHELQDLLTAGRISLLQAQQAYHGIGSGADNAAIINPIARRMRDADRAMFAS